MFDGVLLPPMLIATSLVSAVLALVILPWLPLPRVKPAVEKTGSGDDVVFLFDNEQLLDATPSAYGLLSLAPGQLTDWQRFLMLMSPRFPNLSAELSRLAEVGKFCLSEVNGAARLRALWINGVFRISLTDASDDDDVEFDQSWLDGLNAELRVLRSVAENMPGLAWQIDSKGDIVWANKAYLELAEQHLAVHGAALTWPLPQVFSDYPPERVAEGAASLRTHVTMPDGSVRRFDCRAAQAGSTGLMFATPAEAAANAETALAEFRQTLVQTFAMLPTGLAIFNRARNLVMFNPALTDMFLLEPEFLIARPSLDAFLDRLREKQMVPEQRNFSAWRQKMGALSDAKDTNTQRENWALPSGQTFKLTKRPFPDGAIAFLFEDVSSEISLTRRFRSELEVSRAVFDTMDQAVAIFSAGGVLTMANKAYCSLWNHNPNESLGDVALQDCGEIWLNGSANSANTAVTGLTRAVTAKTAWSGQLVGPDNAKLACSVVPLTGGSVMVSFSNSAKRNTHSNKAQEPQTADAS